MMMSATFVPVGPVLKRNIEAIKENVREGLDITAMDIKQAVLFYNTGTFNNGEWSSASVWLRYG